MLLSRRFIGLFTFVFLLLSPAVHGQGELLYGEFFYNMQDFLSGEEEPIAALGEVESQSDRYVLFRKFTNPETGKKDKKAKYAWALMLDSIPYLNLAFTKDLYQKNAFVQMDFVGRYCVATISEDEKWLNWTSESLVGTGIAGKALRDLKGIRFPDSLGVKRSVLYIDTKEVYTEPFSGNTGGMGKYAYADRLYRIYKNNRDVSYEGNLYDISYEEIINLFKTLNRLDAEKRVLILIPEE